MIKTLKGAQEELERRRAEFKRRDAQKEAAAVSRAMMEKEMMQFMGRIRSIGPTESADTAE